MLVKPFAARHTTDELGDRFRISIPSRKLWLLILFLGFWLAFWVLGEVTALGVLFSKGFSGQFWFLLIWLVGWTIGGGFAFYIILWQLIGIEIIDVSSQSISLGRSVLGFRVPKQYSAEYIKDLRISNLTPNDFSGWSRSLSAWGLGSGAIAFDYGSRTIRFGCNVDEAEAKQIISEIQSRYPQYRSRPLLEDTSTS